MNLPRRLVRLEAAMPAPPAPAIDPEQYQAWLATLPEPDFDIMAEAAEHWKAGNTYGDLSVATLEAMDRILATWDAWQEGATS